MAVNISDAAGAHEVDPAPALVVERFLDLLRRGDVDGAVDLLAVDVAYENVGLPTIHGRERVRRAFRATLGRAASGFDVQTHSISARGPTVLTERTDVLMVRRLHIQLWVCGRFDVHNGQIVLWRDYFDQAAFIAGAVRGLIGTVLPAARAKWPVDRRDAALTAPTTPPAQPASTRRASRTAPRRSP
jgi:limonene-1,2-epoxide hydrolase